MNLKNDLEIFWSSTRSKSKFLKNFSRNIPRGVKKKRCVAEPFSTARRRSSSAVKTSRANVWKKIISSDAKQQNTINHIKQETIKSIDKLNKRDQTFLYKINKDQSLTLTLIHSTIVVSKERRGYL